MKTSKPTSLERLACAAIMIVLVAESSAQDTLVQKQRYTARVGNTYGAIVSPDGKHVYMLSHFPSALFLFDRDPESGILSEVPNARFNLGHGIVSAQSFSPDGNYVVTNLRPPGLNRIAVYRREKHSGELSMVAPVPQYSDFSWTPNKIAFSPDGSRLLVSSRLTPKLWVFDFDQLTGQFKLLCTIDLSSSYDTDFSFQAFPRARFVYVYDYFGSSLSVFEIRNGSAELVQEFSPFAEEVDRFDMRATRIVAKSLYLPLNGSIYTFRMDESNGRLTLIDRNVELQDQQQYRFYLNERHIIAIRSPPTHVAFFALDDDSGIPLLTKSVDTGLDLIDYTVEAIASLAPDGKQFYFPFPRRPGYGILQLDVENSTVDVFDTPSNPFVGPVGMRNLSSIATIPSGEFLYAGGSTSVTAYSRSAATGIIEQIDAEFDVSSPIYIPADGRNLYAQSLSPYKGIATFRRDDVSGCLNLIDRKSREDYPSAVFETSQGLVVTKDGSLAYTLDRDLAVFDRHPLTGVLTYRETFHELSEEIPLRSPLGMFLGIDDQDLYVYDRRTITLLSIDLATGHPNLEHQHELPRASFITIAPGGEYLYGSFLNESGFHIYDRDLEDGFLTTPDLDPTSHRDMYNELFPWLSFDSRGDYLICTSRFSRGLFILKRDVQSGDLQFVENLRTLPGMSPNAHYRQSLVTSDDGYLYVVGGSAKSDDAIAINVLERQPERIVEGFVQTETVGIPVSGAAVLLLDSANRRILTASTDENGYFYFSSVKEGMYNLRVDAPGFRSQAAGPLAVAEHDSPVAIVTVAPLEVDTRISGTVVDELTGDHIVGASVTASSSGVALASTYTNALGEFEIASADMLPGIQIRFRVVARDYNPLSIDIDVNRKGVSSVIFPLTACHPKTMTLEGTVIHGVDDNPLTGARVTTNGPIHVTTCTDGEGEYFLELPPGTYELRGSFPGLEGEFGIRRGGDGAKLKKQFELSESHLVTDLNMDGEVNSEDFQLVLNAILNDRQADINGDGTTNASDLQRVLNVLLS